MKIYFAHPVTDYGTERQAKALAALRAHFVDDLGRRHFEIENPDQPHHQAGYAEHGMEYFKAIVGECSHLAFMRFPDGSIGAGVGREINWAHIANLHVYEVFDGRLYPTPDKPSPILTVEETRETIAALSVPAAAVVGEPEGWKLVPIEPTVAMVEAADIAGARSWHTGERMAAAILKAGITAAPSAPDGWQPIDTAPRDGTVILARYQWGGESRFLVIRLSNMHRWWVTDHDGLIKHDEEKVSIRNYNFTHWRPLPEAPK